MSHETSRTHTIGCTPNIPDYIIYDEIKRRRERAWEPECLEMPPYRPNLPAPDEEVDEEEDPDEGARGVCIIDMNDLPDLDEDA